MAHRSSFRGRGISQSQRRKKTWTPFFAPATFDGITFGSVNQLILNFQAAEILSTPSGSGQTVGFFSQDDFPEESTILRIRGSLELQKNELPISSSGRAATFAIGIGVMERTAAELGVVPNPASPDGAAWDGWMFYRSTMLPPVEAESSTFDVKSMRKVQGGYSMIVVAGSFQASPDDGTTDIPAISASMVARALVLLP